MDLLFRHFQNKKDKKGPGESTCELKLFGDDETIIMSNDFELDYHRYSSRKHVTFSHQLTINLINGDITVFYKIKNDNLSEDKFFKSSQKSRRNNFRMLYEMIENGFYRGEKRLNYWGVKYDRAITEINLIITNKLKSKFKCDFYLNKSYKEKPAINELFDMIVDFHLSQKNIKGHNNVYYDIQDIYPNKKFLLKNENKFLPAVLDSLGIKSKFLIKELNSSDIPLNINAINYLCKLFGKNYLDYLKKINWKQHCCDVYPSNLKIHELKNEFEKSSFVKLINNWNKTNVNIDPIFYSFDRLLKYRKDVELNGIEIKLTPKNDNQFNNLIETLSNLKLYYKRGYKLKYEFPIEFLKDVQANIQVDDEIYKIKVLSTEEEFIYEGYNMKNCMSKQFTNAFLYIYISVQLKTKKINLQYRKGQLVQSYGKSNTPTPSIFQPLIDILNEKFKNYKELKWTKEKYDFLNN